MEYKAFSVIYSADWDPLTHNCSAFRPRNIKLWDLTEIVDNKEGSDIEGWKHRKWVALLSHKQFDRFIQETQMFADPVETGGSIGAPGFGFGWAPAICFCCEDDGTFYTNMYVTPIPKLKDGEEKISEEMWDEIKADILEQYG